jgi:RES domain-containing protein
VRFFRIARGGFDTTRSAFSGLGASKANHRWTWASSTMRAVYCSDSLALACLECLVHVRPLPRRFAPGFYYIIDIPDRHLERPKDAALPAGWRVPVVSGKVRDFGTKFIVEQRAVALVVPSAILPVGLNAVVNPLHTQFRLDWVEGPHPFQFDERLE